MKLSVIIMAVKETKRDILNYVLEKYSNDEKLVAYATHEIELLDKKASNKVATKTQKENVEIKDIILSILTDTPARIAEIQAKNDKLKDLSNQKISSLLTQLVKEDKVERVVDKKNTYFKLR
jgi:hypothetical protein